MHSSRVQLEMIFAKESRLAMLATEHYGRFAVVQLLYGMWVLLGDMHTKVSPLDEEPLA